MLLPLLLMWFAYQLMFPAKKEAPPPPPDYVSTEITGLGKMIEVYAQKEGQYPLKLDQMVPLYIPSIPGGYTYTVEPGAFTLVNVGTHQQYVSGKGLENPAP